MMFFKKSLFIFASGLCSELVTLKIQYYEKDCYSICFNIVYRMRFDGSRLAVGLRRCGIARFLLG